MTTKFGIAIIIVVVNLSLQVSVQGAAAIASPNSGIDELLRADLDHFLVNAVRVAEPPVIDGDLSDSCWAALPRYSRFVQALPSQESVATESTAFWCAYDQSNIYFAFDCTDGGVDRVSANMRRRDDLGNDDFVQLMLDTFNDRRYGYVFIVNALGCQSDGIKTLDGSDDSWDANWHSAGKVTATGWQAEIAIPFQAIRFPSGEQRVWRIQIMRYLQRNGEVSTYVPLRKSDNNDMERTAPLVGR